MAKTGVSEAAKKRGKAGRVLLAGKGCAEVALTEGVARKPVCKWKLLLGEGGIDALTEVPERGRPAQLDERQLAALRAAILQNFTEHGFGTKLWTLKRVSLSAQLAYAPGRPRVKRPLFSFTSNGITSRSLQASLAPNACFGCTLGQSKRKRSSNSSRRT